MTNNVRSSPQSRHRLRRNSLGPDQPGVPSPYSLRRRHREPTYGDTQGHPKIFHQPGRDMARRSGTYAWYRLASPMFRRTCRRIRPSFMPSSRAGRLIFHRPGNLSVVGRRTRSGWRSAGAQHVASFAERNWLLFRNALISYRLTSAHRV